MGEKFGRLLAGRSKLHEKNMEWQSIKKPWSPHRSDPTVRAQEYEKVLGQERRSPRKKLCEADPEDRGFYCRLLRKAAGADRGWELRSVRSGQRSVLR